MNHERAQTIQLIQEARDAGSRQSKACEIVGISSKTLQRWCQENNYGDNRLEPSRVPHNKLSAIERQRILISVNQNDYADLSPAKLVPTLADKGIYLGSESTIYRILKAEGQLNHRQKSKPRKKSNTPMPLVATRPNQIYSWDITYLPSSIKGVFYYLYLMLDIYSRKIVGWQVYDNESSALAADLITDVCNCENIRPDEVVLHSDNGSPMKGATMLATLQQLGVMPSFSRPAVSNDNPYSESMFRTLKYRPNYPEKAFVSLQAARAWVQTFTQWYNYEHLHSAIKFITPAQRHAGQDREILAHRSKVYLDAKRKNPHRWSGGIRNWDVASDVYLNPLKQKTKEIKNKAA